MKEMLDKVWDCEDLTDEMLDWFKEVIKRDEGQRLFRAHMNNKRKEKRTTMERPAFQQLRALIWELLTYLHENELQVSYIENGKLETEEGIRKASQFFEIMKNRIETVMECMIFSETFFQQDEETGERQSL